MGNKNSITEKDIRRIIQGYCQSAHRKLRKCIYPGCESIAIDSHLLQKNGILNLIARDNHVYHVGTEPFHEEKLLFQRIGINKAFTFPGFCQKHDNDIFKDIEGKNIDFANYRSYLLFSYRILVNEYRKKEILIDWFTKNLNDFRLKLHTNREYFEGLKSGIRGYKEAIYDIQYYLKYFHTDIEDTDSRNFSFECFNIPRIDICVSGVFNHETTLEIQSRPSFLDEKPLSDVYFVVLPQELNSVVIVGTLNEMKPICWDFILSIKDKDDNMTLRNISDIILSRIENWVCSESFYERIKHNEKDIVKEIHISLNTLIERRKPDFNLFQ